LISRHQQHIDLPMVLVRISRFRTKIRQQHHNQCIHFERKKSQGSQDLLQIEAAGSYYWRHAFAAIAITPITAMSAGPIVPECQTTS
jgi:hypothetical protein